MSKRFPFHISIALLLVLLITPACYTLFQHPRVKRVVYEEVNDKRCNGCHTGDELWSFHHPTNRWYGYGSVTLEFAPWWYTDYWYYADDGPVTVPLPTRQLRPTTSKPGNTMGTGPQPIGKKPSSSPARASKDTKEGVSNDKPSKKRTVRPSKAKESKSKDKDKDKG